MKLLDLIAEDTDVSPFDDVGIADSIDPAATPTSLAQNENNRKTKELTLNGRGKNYKKARAITRNSRKKAEEYNQVQDETLPQKGPEFSTLNFRR